VGAAIGLAVLGAVGSTLASNSWSDDIARLPGPQREGAERLTELVVGGQGDKVIQLSGSPEAGHRALVAFVDGVHGAMLVGAALLLAASLTAFFGLRGVRRRERAAGAPAVEL
jgi:hypothetical protein